MRTAGVPGRYLRAAMMAAAFLGMQTASYAQSAPGDHIVVPAKFKRLPTAEEMRDSYPAGAARNLNAAFTQLKCTIGIDGRLHDCTVENERPAGLGFGAAALSLAEFFSFTPKTVDGRAVPSELDLPINWQPWSNLP